MTSLWTLFLCFAKIGGFTFGGGYAMLPILQREVVEKYHWTSEEELLDYYAIGQCTPGIIAVNTATFIGYKQRGILGSLAATLGMISPSIFIIALIAAVLENFSNNPYVISALAGIQVCVCALVFMAVLQLAKKSVKDTQARIIFLLVLAATLFLGITTSYVIFAIGLLGFFQGIYLLKKKGGIKS